MTASPKVTDTQAENFTAEAKRQSAGNGVGNGIRSIFVTY